MELLRETDRPVTEVCLVESQLHPKGANYEVVETVSLGEPRTMG